MVWEWGNPSHTHTSLGFFSFLLIQPKNLRESILSDPINGPSAPSLNRLSVLLKKAFSVHMHPFFFFVFLRRSFSPPILLYLPFAFPFSQNIFVFCFFFLAVYLPCIIFCSDLVKTKKYGPSFIQTKKLRAPPLPPFDDNNLLIHSALVSSFLLWFFAFFVHSRQNFPSGRPIL